MQLRIALPNGEEHPYEVTAETTYESFMEHVSELVAVRGGFEIHLGEELLDEALWEGLSDGDSVRVVAAWVTLRVFLPDGTETSFRKTSSATYSDFEAFVKRFSAAQCAAGPGCRECLYICVVPRDTPGPPGPPGPWGPPGPPGPPGPWGPRAALAWERDELKDGDVIRVFKNVGRRIDGRPYYGPGGEALCSEVTGESTPDDGWSPCAALAVPDGPAADAETLQAAAADWMAAASAEHASVASFSKFSIQLMSVAAPADLVEAAHHAALQEVKHAKLCLRVASMIQAMGHGAPAPAGLGRFPPHALEVSGDLVQMAESTAREGAFGETAAALLAAVRLHLVKTQGDSAVVAEIRSVLEQVTVEEAEHAALGWKTLRWANVPVDFSTIGGGAGAAACEVDLSSPQLRFSLLRPAETAALTAAVRREVVLPMAGQIASGGPVSIELPEASMLRRYGGGEVTSTLRYLLALVNGRQEHSG
eukprot:TRINITY_DN440_c0_g3_i1.p1 TRINITY_DN440_c0_g3~~TRINITY_DN440_c0_g3_i1.p1  ORF type:complete len:478 (+),score=131.03 TRINITY_DN440_c0_g3_i1:76-1509(+)